MDKVTGPWKEDKADLNLITHKFNTQRWFRGRVVCALDYEAGDPGSIPGSGGTTDWLFRTGW